MRDWFGIIHASKSYRRLITRRRLAVASPFRGAFQLAPKNPMTISWSLLHRGNFIETGENSLSPGSYRQKGVYALSKPDYSYVVWMHASIKLLYHMGKTKIYLPKRASIVYRNCMKKDTGFRIRVQRDLREKFIELCRAQDRPAAQVLREYMRVYVAEHEAANDGATTKRKRRKKQINDG